MSGNRKARWSGGVSREERALRAAEHRQAAQDAKERKAAKDRWSRYVQSSLRWDRAGFYRHRAD